MTPTGNHQLQHRMPNKIVSSCGGLEPEDEDGEGGEGVKNRKKPPTSCRCDVEDGEGLCGCGGKRRQESVGSEVTDRGYLYNCKEVRGKCKALRAETRTIVNIVCYLCRV